MRLVKLRQRDTELAKLILGRPACERPFAGTRLFHHIRVAIDKAGVRSSAASVEEESGFAEDLGVEAPPLKKKRVQRLRGLDFVEVDVLTKLGSPEAGTRAIVFEISHDLSMDAGEALESIQWLIAAVLAERQDKTAESVAGRA